MPNIIKSRFEILTQISTEMLRTIESAGRVCYKSEDRITETSYLDFLRMIVKNKHFSVIEHVIFSVRLITDRGVTHEVVRHRIVSYSQESTRYCNYAKGRFGNQITVIDKRPFLEVYGEKAIQEWLDAMADAERHYINLVSFGVPPEHARGVLPTDVKTEIICTANLREWGHIFALRTAERAHPCMRDLMIPLLNEIRKLVPIIYDDLSLFA